jgi:hypothetical protein
MKPTEVIANITAMSCFSALMITAIGLVILAIKFLVFAIRFGV